MAGFLREYILEIGSVVAGVGLVFTILSVTAYVADPGYLAGYEEVLSGGWNLWVMGIAPVMLLFGAWYAGEQIWLRRRFREKIEMERRSQYRDRIRDLEEIVQSLPKRYEERLDEEAERFEKKR